MNDDLLALAEPLRDYLLIGDAGPRATQPVATAVKVRPLEWDKHPDDDEWYSIDSGNYQVSDYCVYHSPNSDGWCLNVRGHLLDEDFSSSDAAKAAAQADYEQRIRSALVNAPMPASDGALREAISFYRSMSDAAIYSGPQVANILECHLTRAISAGLGKNSDGRALSSLSSGESDPVVTQDYRPSETNAPEQAEPVAWATPLIGGDGTAVTSQAAMALKWRDHGADVTPLYAHPPASVDAIKSALNEHLQCISDDDRCHTEIIGIDEAASAIAALIAGGRK